MLNPFQQARLEELQKDKEANQILIQQDKEKQDAHVRHTKGTTYAEVTTTAGKIIRVYSLRDHGENFLELAEQFARKQRAKQFRIDPNDVQELKKLGIYH